MKIPFLDLGIQPLSNGFVGPNERTQWGKKLSVGFDPDTKLVSLMDFVDKSAMFNEDYPYKSSGSETMRQHFADAAKHIKNYFPPKDFKILEIGSNDGVFIKHFNPTEAIAVEPCTNFAHETRRLGYITYDEFWTQNLADKIVERHGHFDCVYAANCMCHIPEVQEAFDAVASVLNKHGRFIFEDPSLERMIDRNSFDQIYDEHAHIFSLIAIRNLLDKSGMQIRDVKRLDTHGGSNRITASKIFGKTNFGRDEIGLDEIYTFYRFADRVTQNADDLMHVLKALRRARKKVIAYGATSKLTALLNACGIDRNLIEYVTDTTPEKQGKCVPGVMVPIVSPDQFDDSVDFALLGAWNYQDEILAKEKDYKGKWITHIPHIRIF